MRQGGAAALFEGYEAIALIANSEDLDLEAVQASLPERTVFVFFTRCMRVIKKPFARDAVLIHLLKQDLTFNESRKIAAEARALFAEGALKGEIGLKVGRGGVGASIDLTSPEGDSVDHRIDCNPLLSWYTPGKAPTTGFAAALWLRDNVGAVPIHLCGFTGLRSTQFTMRTMHDWTLEQAVLRLLYSRGELIRHGASRDGLSLPERVALAVPGAEPAEIIEVVSDVFEARLTALDKLMARLVSVLRLPLTVDRWLKGRK